MCAVFALLLFRDRLGHVELDLTKMRLEEHGETFYPHRFRTFVMNIGVGMGVSGGVGVGVGLRGHCKVRVSWRSSRAKGRPR